MNAVGHVGTQVSASAGRAITRLTARSLLRGSLLMGLLVGGMAMLQGLAYAATYTTPAARQELATAMAGNPAFGMLYGNPADAVTPAGYVLFRCLPFLSVAAGIWGLLTATRLFRGQEESGRTELLLAGATTAGRAAWRTLLGFGSGLGIVLGMGTVFLTLTGLSKDVAISVGDALFFSLAVTLSAAFFISVGLVTSQLAATRRRATLYGLVPLIIWVVLRGLAHIVDNGQWLQNWTPFGWLEKSRPILENHVLWLGPIAGATVLLVAVGLYLASRRDVGSSVIAERAVTKPRYRLLATPSALALRLNAPVFLGWLVAVLGIAALMTSIAKTAVEAVTDSDTVADALHTLTGSSAGLAVAFVGMSSFLVAVLLMIVAASGMGAIRSEEGKSYLDNFLARPVSRTQWLGGRLAVLFGALAVMCLVANTLTWLIASLTDIPVAAPRMILGGLSMLGPVCLLVGAGVFVYGWLPRWAAAVMYVIVGGSFLIDMISSVVSVSPVVTHASLLHYIALVPAATPDWLTFGWTVLTGVVLAIAGAYLFTRRDLQVE